MSPVSALCFALIGISLILSTLRGRPRWAPPIAGTLSSVVASISLVAVLGYALDLPGTYGWGQLTKVALHTAVALGLAGGALFIIAWHTGLRPGETTPRWLPAPLMLGVFVASLIFYLALGKKQNEEIAQTVQASAESVKNSLSVRLDARSHALMRMAARWKYAGGAERGAWEDDATHYLRDFPDWQAIEWIDATHLVRWIVPLAGNEAKIGQDLTQEPNRKAAIEQAEREQQPVVTRMVTLFRGGVGFILYVPLQAKGQPDGFLAAVVDAQACLTRYLPPAVAEGEEIMLSESGRQFFQRGDGIAPAHEEWIAEAKVEARGTDWDLKMWPTPALAARLDSPMPNVILLAGVLGALMLGAVCYYAQRALRHAAETERANRALKTALDQVRTLEGLLPICSCCKRVRDDTGYWNQIDTYIHQHTNASLSHGYCPECAAKTFKEWGFEIPSEVQAQVDAGRFEQSRP
jgi:sensor domain CHASE-containing protein